MIKRSLIVLTAVLALTAFGTVSSAHAFIDPVSLTVILGVTMIAAVTGAEIFYHKEQARPGKKTAGPDDQPGWEEAAHSARAVPGE